MNFKPNLLKILVSLVVGSIVLIYIAGTIRCKLPQECGLASGYQVLLSLFSIIVVYLVWSLLQEGKHNNVKLLKGNSPKKIVAKQKKKRNNRK